MNIGRKVLIFDLGGVILDIHAEKTFSALAELGLQPSFLNEAYCVNDSMMQRFERGLLSVDEMFSYVEGALDCTHVLSPQELRSRVVDAWCAMLGDIDEAKLHSISELRAKGYRVLLLSNTNEVHWGAVEQKFMEKGFLPSNCFDKLYLSYKMGYIKPGQEIFLQLLKSEGVSAGDCIFFDDSQANCDAAKELGIDAVLVERNTSWNKNIINV